MNRKIVFLDIDDVLQPSWSCKRFQFDKDDIVNEIVDKTGDESYRYLDPYDVAAVAKDWDAESVSNLREILDETGAVIVIESSWRDFNDIHELRLLFGIWNLDSYIEFSLPRGNKEDVIRDYLTEHPEVSDWIVIDDMPLDLGEKHIRTVHTITEQDKKQAIDLLGGKRNGSDQQNID